MKVVSQFATISIVTSILFSYNLHVPLLHCLLKKKTLLSCELCKTLFMCLLCLGLMKVHYVTCAENSIILANVVNSQRRKFV